MSSIIPGYEYDIFISYRQKDNKGDKWVSEFVDALKTELESTFKDDVSVYFDINPHDGLLETYNVDASLKGKLKCLVFIPVISQTYCDSKSFAWQHEFCAFNKMAKEDMFGRDIRLTGGNITSRILPVKIHDIDGDDNKTFEDETGGLLRAIEFIYRQPGVNRPLSPDDNTKDNLNGTKYRNQINKVANAVKEIITALKRSGQLVLEDSKDAVKIKPGNKKNLSPKIIIACVILLLLIISGYFLIPKIFTPVEPADKSIAVLPFVNMSKDPDEEFFSDGMMQEILNHLFKIGGLKIPSSTSSMRFKGSKLSVTEIAKELGVTYVLEGNVSRSGDNARVIVRLINGKNGQLLWTEDYRPALTAINLLEIQSDVARQVADKMKVVINPEVKQRIEAKPTSNTEAYTLFLKAFNPYLTNDQAKSMMEQVITLDPGFADAYSYLANLWIFSGGYNGFFGREQVLGKAEPLLKKSIQLDENSLVTHTSIASLRLYYYWDFESVDKEFQICTQLNPSNSDLIFPFTDYLLASGKFSEAFILTKRTFDLNKSSGYYWSMMAVVNYYNGQTGKSFETIETASHLFPSDDDVYYMQIKLLIYMGKYEKAIELFEKHSAGKQFDEIIPCYLGYLGIAYNKAGDKSKAATFLNELLARRKKAPIGSPSFYAAQVYASMGENDRALQMLEKAYTDREVEMYWSKVDPLFKPLYGDQRFKTLLFKIGFK